MNKLLFTLSLVVLVAAPGFCEDNNVTDKGNTSESAIIEEYYISFKEYVLPPLFEICENNTESQKLIPEILHSTFFCLYDIAMVYFKPFLIELKKDPEDRRMRILFKNFCEGTDKMIICGKPLYNTIHPCFDEDELEGVEMLKNLFDQLLGYVCYNHGEKVRRYFSNKDALDCFNEHMGGLKECATPFIKKHFDSDSKNINYETLDEDEDEDQQCQDLREVHKCSVTELEKCEDKKSSITADDLFEIVLNATSCEEEINNGVNKNSETFLLLAASVLIATIKKLSFY